MSAAVLRHQRGCELHMGHAVKRRGRSKEQPQTGQSLMSRRQVHLAFRPRSRSTLATSPQAITSGLAARRYSRSVLPLWP
jgi:hypothetical protein